MRRRVLRWAAALGLAGALILGAGVQARQGAGARAITLGPWTRYLGGEPSLYVRLHEAAHRRQFRREGWLAWVRYGFDFDARLRMEAEADALARCAQGITLVPGPDTFARSRMHATIYAFWWWEDDRAGGRDHVGDWVRANGACPDVLTELDEEGRIAWREAAERLAALASGSAAPHERTVPVGAPRTARPTEGGTPVLADF